MSRSLTDVDIYKAMLWGIVLAGRRAREEKNMPCSDGGPSPTQEKLNEATDLLCSLMQLVIDEGFEIDAGSKLGIWWFHHQAADRERVIGATRLRKKGGRG